MNLLFFFRVLCVRCADEEEEEEEDAVQKKSSYIATTPRDSQYTMTRQMRKKWISYNPHWKDVLCVFFLSTYFKYFSQLVFVLVARFCARFLNVHNSREELNLDRQICIQSEREYE